MTDLILISISWFLLDISIQLKRIAEQLKERKQ